MNETRIDPRGYLHLDKTTTIRDLESIDITALKAKVGDLDDAYWEAENARKPNKFEAFGSTRHIVMKFVKELTSAIYYRDLPAWGEWQELVEPILLKVQEAYGYEKAEFPRAMLAKVPPEGEIGIHADGGKFPPFCHKVHVPLFTNPDVGFFVEPSWHHLPEGRATEVNNAARHMVRNGGGADRIHLIFELFKSPVRLEEHQYVGAVAG